jgi:hypothetical protein
MYHAISEVHLVICEGRHFTHVRKKHLHDHIISLRVNAWAHITSLIPPLFIVVHTLTGQCANLYMC